MIITVGTTATCLCGCDYYRKMVTIQNNTEVDIYIGGRTVTTTSYGYILRAGESLQIPSKCPVYGVVSADTQPIAVLISK